MQSAMRLWSAYLARRQLNAKRSLNYAVKSRAFDATTARHAMPATITPRLTPRYAHIPGLTRLQYSLDGKYLISVGANRLIRKFIVGSEDEPITIEQHDDNITSVAVTLKHFATCSDDGTVSLFGIESTESTLFTRNSLPVRDIAFSEDGQWLASASE